MMTLVTRKVFGNLTDNGCSAEVTLCPTGVNGWHVHTTYSVIYERNSTAGVCGDRATEDEAVTLYEHAIEMAREWFRKNNVS